MKVNRQDLANALNLACKVARRPTKRGSSGLTNVRLIVHCGELAVVATDLMTFVEVMLQDENRDHNEMWDILVPAHEFFKFVKPEKKITYETVDLTILPSNEIAITLDNGNTRQFTYENGELFPTDIRPAVKVATYQSNELRSALKFVLQSVSTDTTRPHICRVAFLHRRIAATDGHRLHVARTSTMGPLEVTVSPIVAELIVAASNVSNPFKFDMYLEQDESKNGFVTFKSARYAITTKLISLDFPPIDEVIPAKADHYVVNVKNLKAALKAAAHDNVRLTCNGTITIDVETPDAKSHSVVNTIKAPNDKVIAICVFRPYLLEALNVDDNSIELQVTGPFDPIRVDHDNGTAVIMPMRL